MKYSCLKKYGYGIERYRIVTLREQDIYNIKQWRNDQIKFLRQNKILTDIDQKTYYETVVAPTVREQRPPLILFSYLLEDKCIGYGGLTNIDWVCRRAEISFLIETERSKDVNIYTKDFSIFIRLMKMIAFDELVFNRLFTETYEIRPHVILCLERNGFRLEGKLRQHVLKEHVFLDSLIHGYLKEYYYDRVEEGIHEIITFDTEHSSIEKTRKQQLSVLVTSISSKVPMLKSLRQGINKLGTNLRIIGADTNPNCIGRYFVDSFWHMPKLSEMTAGDIIDYGLAENVAAIIPTRDGELPFFSEHKSMFAEKSMCVMVPSLETVKTCLDKNAFYQILRSYSFPGIETVLKIEEMNVPYYVVKERFGAGSRHIGLKLTKEQAIAHAKSLENPVFQPYVDGNEVSIDVYVDAKGKSKGAIVRTREVVVGGESQVTVTKNDPELERLCSRLAERLQLYGHAVFQVIIDTDGDYHFVECNCRFGGASTLSLDAGLDSFYWFLLESTGQSIAEYKFIRSSTEKRQVRFPQDVIFDENASVSNGPSAP